MKKLIFLICLVCLFITSMLWASGLSGIIIAGGGGTVSAVPAAPTGVSATAGNAQNMVTWTASSGSTSCNLYWKSGSSMSGNCTGNGTKVIGVSSPDVITSLTNGTTYYYMLTAVNSTGEGACSSEVSAMPTCTSTKLGGYGTTTASSGFSINYTVLDTGNTLSAGTFGTFKVRTNNYAVTGTVKAKVFRLSGSNYILVGSSESFA